MKRLLGVLAVGSLMLLGPVRARAALTCDGDIGITYVNPQASYKVGDVVTVEVSFGTGDIFGGTMLTFPSFQFDLDCDPTVPLSPPCTDDGPVISYNGDGSIMNNTCAGITWASNLPAGGTSPNQLTFTPTPALDVPPDQAIPPGFCHVDFQVTIATLPSSGTEIPELVSYGLPPFAGAPCDNGLDTGGFQTTALSLASPTDYDCYQTPRKNTLKPPPVVTLVDRFGSSTSTVVNYHRLCAPADKNGDNPTAPSNPAHYVAGTLTKTSGSIAQPKGLHIDYQFGTLTADLSNPTFLFLPASKSLTSPPPAPPTGLRHLQCYRLTNVKGDRTGSGTVIDQFTSAAGVPFSLVKAGPWRLCVPVDKNGEDPSAPSDLTDNLLCNTPTTPAFGQFDVFVSTQFSTDFELIGTQYDDLCMPATIH
jgi:hypothetical protein